MFQPNRGDIVADKQSTKVLIDLTVQHDQDVTPEQVVIHVHNRLLSSGDQLVEGKGTITGASATLRKSATGQRLLTD